MNTAADIIRRHLEKIAVVPVSGGQIPPPTGDVAPPLPPGAAPNLPPNMPPGAPMDPSMMPPGMPPGAPPPGPIPPGAPMDPSMMPPGAPPGPVPPGAPMDPALMAQPPPNGAPPMSPDDLLSLLPPPAPSNAASGEAMVPLSAVADFVTKIIEAMKGRRTREAPSSEGGGSPEEAPPDALSGANPFLSHLGAAPSDAPVPLPGLGPPKTASRRSLDEILYGIKIDKYQKKV